MYTDQQIAGSILRTPDGKYFKYSEGKGFTEPSSYGGETGGAPNVKVVFKDGCQLCIPGDTPKTAPNRQQKDYYKANSLRGKSFANDRTYHAIGQGRPVGTRNAVVSAVQKKKEKQWYRDHDYIK